MTSKKHYSTTAEIILIFLIAIIIVSCGNNNTGKQEPPMAEEDKAMDSLKKINAEKVIYSIPSPIETAVMLRRAGAKFDKEVLNKTENADKYSTMNSKALNLGIYGADLSYATTFNKTQEAMLYLKTAKKLADAIGITNAFGTQSVERMEANMKNKDSLQSIIADSFWEADSYLKENDRANVAALIVVGGWIEGLHLAIETETVLRKTKTNKEMMNRIADQKITLESLIGFLESYKTDETLSNIIMELNQLQTIFNEIEIVESETATVSTINPATKVTTVGSPTTVIITDAHIDKVAKKVNEIRKRIIE